jgi:hypothetical protein
VRDSCVQMGRNGCPTACLCPQRKVHSKQTFPI